MLEIVHLVESARYHLSNLERLTSGQGTVPPGFEAGVDFEGVVLDSHWRVMASLIEFEAFLSVTKRCLDRAWCCLGERLGGEASNVRTLARAIHKLKRGKDQGVKKVLQELEYFAVLERAWREWGRDAANLRNYVEHGAPVGGRAFGFTEFFGDSESVKLFVPDKIPEQKENPGKRGFTFTKQLTIDVFSRDIMVRLDLTMIDILREGDALKNI